MDISFSVTIDGLTLESAPGYDSSHKESIITAKITVPCESVDGPKYIVAMWTDHELQFVGSRPFKCNHNTFMTLASIGQNLLDLLDKE